MERIRREFGQLKIGDVWFHTETSTAQMKKIEEPKDEALKKCFGSWNATCIAYGTVSDRQSLSMGKCQFIEPDRLVFVEGVRS